MPFKSLKQEQYLMINEPKIWKDWVKKYGHHKDFKKKKKAKASDENLQIKNFKGTYYHQTSESASKLIIKQGFSIYPGGNQRFSEGVYLLNHPEGRFGDVTLSVDFDGNYLDLSKDVLGKQWVELKEKYMDLNYSNLTDNLKKVFPTAQGIMFNNILVIWDLSSIKKTEIFETVKAVVASLFSKNNFDLGFEILSNLKKD